MVVIVLSDKLCYFVTANNQHPRFTMLIIFKKKIRSKIFLMETTTKAETAKKKMCIIAL
jgi:hypothetical protein